MDAQHNAAVRGTCEQLGHDTVHKGLVCSRATFDVMIGQRRHSPMHRAMVSVPPSGQFRDTLVLFGMHVGATTPWLLVVHLVMTKAVKITVEIRQVRVENKVRKKRICRFKLLFEP